MLDIADGTKGDLILYSAIRHETGAPILVNASGSCASMCEKSLEAGADGILTFRMSREAFLYKVYYSIGKTASARSAVNETAVEPLPASSTPAVLSVNQEIALAAAIRISCIWGIFHVFLHTCEGNLRRCWFLGEQPFPDMDTATEWERFF